MITIIILNYDRTSIGAWTHDREAQPFFARLRMISDPDLSLSKNRAICFMGVGCIGLAPCWSPRAPDGPKVTDALTSF